jgi:hypothetical protein
METIPDWVAKTKEVLRRHRVSPVAFVREAVSVEPTEQQAQLLDAISKPGAHVAVRSGHGTGKSTALAWLLLWFLCTHPDARVPCTAPTEHQLKDILWPEIGKWHGRLHVWYRENLEVSSEYVRVVGSSSYGVRRTSTKERPEALQGFHARNLLFLIDEASGIPEQIFEVAEGALSTPGARVVMAANPTRVTGYFHRAFYRDRDLWVRLHFSAEDSPLVSKEWVRKMEEKYGRESDIFRVRVAGDFPSASVVQLIPLSLIEAAFGKHLREEQYSFAPVVLGVDVAWEGDDRSAVFLRQGLRSALLGVWLNIDNMTLAGLVAEFEDRYRADAVFVDVGWGTGVIDRLRQMGRRPIPVNFGGRAVNVDRYENIRAEMWCKMKEWLESGGALPPEEDLKDDLAGPEYGFTVRGRIQLERKEDMKKRGLASPDLADALALTFAAPVVRRDERQRPEFSSGRTYDVLARRG